MYCRESTVRSLTPSSNHTFTRRAKSLLLPALLFFTLVAWGTIPPGYYNGATGKTGEALQIALYDIIKGHTVVSYTPGVWNAFYSTDKKANGKVWDMYTDIPEYRPECRCMNSLSVRINAVRAEAGRRGIATAGSTRFPKAGSTTTLR